MFFKKKKDTSTTKEKEVGKNQNEPLQKREKENTIKREVKNSPNSEDVNLDEFLSEEERLEKEKKKKIEEIKEKAKEKVIEKKKEEKKESLKEVLTKNKYLISNIILILSIIGTYIISTDYILPSVKNLIIYKNDIPKVKKDIEIVQNNLKLLKDEKDKALEYRRLNFFLEQAIPKKDNYEDNLYIILNILNESITKFSKEKRYLSTLALKPDTKLKDVQVFNSENERILAISYNISVEGFKRYKDIKDFIDLITGRVRIFHISRLTITKTYDQKVKETKYKLSFQMYSYYRLPKVDEFGNSIVLEKESTF